mmetsp:Transcript_48133/g.99488  ORF Transcript_48133/g.99488 Transcript_48133/m.99488 type:complete len:205 (-) Transcript_48133:9-623(-)
MEPGGATWVLHGLPVLGHRAEILRAIHPNILDVHPVSGLCSGHAPPEEARPPALDEDDNLLHSSMPAGLKDRCGWGLPGSKLPLRQSDVPKKPGVTAWLTRVRRLPSPLPHRALQRGVRGCRCRKAAPRAGCVCDLPRTFRSRPPGGRTALQAPLSFPLHPAQLQEELGSNEAGAESQMSLWLRHCVTVEQTPTCFRSGSRLRP